MEAVVHRYLPPLKYSVFRSEIVWMAQSPMQSELTVFQPLTYFVLLNAHKAPNNSFPGTLHVFTFLLTLIIFSWLDPHSVHQMMLTILVSLPWTILPRFLLPYRGTACNMDGFAIWTSGLLRKRWCKNDQNQLGVKEDLDLTCFNRQNWRRKKPLPSGKLILVLVQFLIKNVEQK